MFLKKLVVVAQLRGLKTLGRERYLSVHRYRQRKGLPPSMSSGALTDGPDWSYPNRQPGEMNLAQTKRYIRDQDMGKMMVKFNEEQFKPILDKRKLFAKDLIDDK